MSTIYIKTKHLKQLILLLACVFLASFNYFTYAETTTANSATTCNKAIDSDCDGLTNAEEALYGTDPNNADTDGDGYSDGVEVKSGYDPLKPAPGDKIATGTTTVSSAETSDTSSSSTSSSDPSPTDTFSQNLANFAASKSGQTISQTDLTDFVNQQLSGSLGQTLTVEDLPAIDTSKIKILKQDYSTLSDSERKQKEFIDAAVYIKKIVYLLASNAPAPVLTATDFAAFKKDFYSHLATLAASNDASSFEYFSDLGNRLEVVINQSYDIEVPETMLDLHVKFLRIANGLLTLSDSSQNISDSLNKVALLSKISAYTKLISDFFQNDFANYFSSLKLN